jgi:hypothetical protein
MKTFGIGGGNLGGILYMKYKEEAKLQIYGSIL